MLAKSKTVEDSKIQKRRTTSSTSPPHLSATERKIAPLPSRLRIASTSSSTTPTPEPEPAKPTSSRIVPIPTPSSSSQYAEEYDRCPCSRLRARGRPPCDRCHLMLLADRFCDLIDVQCKTWGIPPKH